MWIKFIIIMCSMQMLSSLNFIDLPVVVVTADLETEQSDHDDKYKANDYKSPVKFEDDSSRELTDKKRNRRYQFSDDRKKSKPILKVGPDSDHLKTKISTLVDQTIYDTEKRLKSIEPIKEKYREHPPYRVGFILSMVKKSRDVLNELFNVAVKHRDSWKVLEQMKIFELIVHTNVDTTNLVRQLVETHIQFLNTSSGLPEGQSTGMQRKRVVLL